MITESEWKLVKLAKTNPIPGNIRFDNPPMYAKKSAYPKTIL